MIILTILLWFPFSTQTDTNKRSLQESKAISPGIGVTSNKGNKSLGVRDSPSLDVHQMRPFSWHTYFNVYKQTVYTPLDVCR